MLSAEAAAGRYHCHTHHGRQSYDSVVAVDDPDAQIRNKL